MYREHSIGPARGMITPGIKWLIISCVAIYILKSGADSTMIKYFGLVPRLALGRFMIWQFVSYLFLHGGIFHLVFNMLVLWMFGTEIERFWGLKRFLHFYFFCGIVAGVVTALVSYGVNIPIIGASGAIFGVLAAFGLLFPETIIFVFFVFPMKAKHAVLLFAGIELLVVMSERLHGLGSLAHLSGMVAGYVFIRHENLFRRAWNLKRERKRTVVLVHDRERSEKKKKFMQELVDPILDKISREGMDSLTKEEKKILKKVREFDES